jgi:TPR repeat protein
VTTVTFIRDGRLPKIDGNGDAGALVKVVYPEPGLVFEGNLIGTPEFQHNEYWVFLTAGARFFIIKVPNSKPINISFADYNLRRAQAKTTYVLRLQEGRQASAKQPSNMSGSQYALEKLKEGNLWYFQKEYEKAIDCYKIAAQEDNADAQYNLGLIYQEGEGVDQDYEEAISWYREAAEQGHRDAQCNLAYCYSQRRKDEDKAAYWYRKAAEQGDAMAQYNLGRSYYNGWGVTQDYTEAAMWMQKAAEQGHSGAQQLLAELYEKGEGVGKDLEKALMWYRKAAEQGNEYAKEKVETWPNW